MMSEEMSDWNQVANNTENDNAENPMDIKIDAVFSLTDDNSEKVNKSRDILENVNKGDLENKSGGSGGSPSVKLNSNGKQSPVTKSCHVVLKKISSHGTVSIPVPGQLNVVADDTMDEKSDRMRPSRKRKPSALLASESYVKTLAEFRSQVTISKMVKKHTQDETKQDDFEIEYCTEKPEDDDHQPIIFNKKKVRKRQSEEKDKSCEVAGKTNENISNFEESDTVKSKKKKKQKVAPETEATETNNEISSKNMGKVGKIKQEPEIDFEFTLTPVPVSPEITVQNVIEFPKETKMKSLLSPKNDPKQDYLKEFSSKSNVFAKQGRVPCSLNGRCIKPNYKYFEEYFTDFSKKTTKKDNSETNTLKNNNSSSVSKKGDNSSPLFGSHIKTECSEIDVRPALQQNTAPYPVMVENTTQPTAAQNKPFLSALLTSHETDAETLKTVYTSQQSISNPPHHNSLIPSVVGHTLSSAVTSVAAKNTSFCGMVSKLLDKTQQKDVAKTAGTTLVSEGTKKFFHLQVGDKVVLIPTDGNIVIPKAYVMDTKQCDQFQSGLGASKMDSDPPVKIKYRSATASAYDKPEVSAAVPPCINRAVSLLANSVGTESRMKALNTMSPIVNEVGLHSSAYDQSTVNHIDYSVKTSNERNKDIRTENFKIKTEPIDEDYNDQEQQVLPELKQEPDPETGQDKQDSEQDRQGLLQDTPEIEQGKPETEQGKEKSKQKSSSDMMPSVEVFESPPSLKEASPPVLTRVENELPAFKDDLLHSPPLLTKSCSFDEPGKEILGGNKVKDKDRHNMYDNNRKNERKDSDVEVLIPETEVEMRIRRLKEQLRQKQLELEKFKMSFGGSKQK